MADQQEVQTPTLEELPKVQSDLKDQLEHFNPETLKNVDPQEKVVLPTAEGAYLIFFTLYNIRYFFGAVTMGAAHALVVKTRLILSILVVVFRRDHNLPHWRNGTVNDPPCLS